MARIPIYHLYYGNGDADVGSIATSFPYPRKPGRAGSGQLSCTSYTVPTGATTFWKSHFDAHGAEHSGMQERFGTKYPARAPSGRVAVRDDRGRERPAQSLDDETDQPRRRDARLLRRRAVGPRRSRAGIVLRRRARLPAKSASTAPIIDSRFRAPAPARIVDLHHEPDRAPGSWGFGAGTAHHIAFNVETDEALVKQKAIYEELGLHRRVRDQGPLLLPLDVRALAWRHPRRVHGERARRVLSGRGAGRTRDDAAPAAVVRGAAGGDRLPSSSRSPFPKPIVHARARCGPGCPSSPRR